VRQRKQQLDNSDYPPRPQFRDSDETESVSSFVRTSNSKSSVGKSGIGGKSLSPEAFPPPVPQFAPPVVPASRDGSGAPLKGSRPLHDIDSVGAEGGNMPLRSVGLEKKYVDLNHGMNDRVSRRQQQQLASYPPTLQKNFSSDVATRTSSSSSHLTSMPPPVSHVYQLLPRHHAVTVCDMVTQTPRSWSDCGSSSARGSSPQYQQRLQRLPVAELLKYTGRAVPGAVINEQHRLWTVVQVMVV
jgi:hypothetical protein